MRRQVGDSDERLLKARQFGRRLRNRRQELRIAMREAAEAVDCTPQFVGELERGLRSMSDVAAWLRLADLLQVDRRWVIENAWECRGTIAVPIPKKGTTDRTAAIDLVINAIPVGLPLDPESE